jgi:hypothetical protein
MNISNAINDVMGKMKGFINDVAVAVNGLVSA